MDDDIKCPHCGSTKYRNPSLRLLVNVCGHALCENCVELLFVKGSASCPKCATPLRRNNFRVQLFEDDFVEKEIDIRRRLLRDFNKKEDDFDSLAEYNDYLELIESIVYNLANNIDVQTTHKKVENYKKDNLLIIAKNKGKLSRDEEFIEELLEREREREITRSSDLVREERETTKAKSKLHEALVDELMFSDLPAVQIMAQHENEVKAQQMAKSVAAKDTRFPKTALSQPKLFSTGIQVGKGCNVFEALPKTIEGVLYEYIEPTLDLNGPKCAPFDALKSDGYLNHVRNANSVELSGGFLPHYPCLRALQESFCALYFQPT